MTEKERLKIYKKALWDYRISKYLRRSILTENGLCYYFYAKEIITLTPEGVYGDGIKILPELYFYKPYDQNYWFNPGELNPRIKLLKKAIKMVKKSIN